MNFLINTTNKLLRRFGIEIVRQKDLQLYYQHDYGVAGFDKYRDIQVYHNNRKLDKIWADEKTLGLISKYVKTHVKKVKAGICHGTRRGFEQAVLSRLLKCTVIGTEISDTAIRFPQTVQWDFHKRNSKWIGAYSVVYSNSLDQAFDPKRALETWVEQLTEDGLLFIEHTMSHSASGASEMDPFGAHPLIMPYLIFEWGRGKYRLADIIRPSHKKHDKYDLWIFVIKKVERLPYKIRKQK